MTITVILNKDQLDEIISQWLKEHHDYDVVNSNPAFCVIDDEKRHRNDLNIYYQVEVS